MSSFKSNENIYKKEDGSQNFAQPNIAVIQTDWDETKI